MNSEEKIIQIAGVASDDDGLLYGISQTGKLYILIYSPGGRDWKLVTKGVRPAPSVI